MVTVILTFCPKSYTINTVYVVINTILIKAIFNENDGNNKNIDIKV